MRYHNREHGSLDMSPFQKAVSWTGSVERIDNPRLLDVLLAERIQRTVQKKGLKIDDAWFIAPELAVNLVGRDVQVRLDPLDLGRVYVFHDGQFICVAECPERTGMNRQEVAQKAKKMQAAEVSRQKRELKAMARKVNTDDVVQEILRHNAAQAGTLVAMPKPAVPVNTAGTRAAAAATHAVDRGLNSQIPAAVQRHLGQATPAPVISLPQSDEAKFRDWLALDALASRIRPPVQEKLKVTADADNSPVEQAPRKRLDLIEPVSARLEMGGLFTIIGYGQELLVDPANALELGSFLVKTAQAMQAR